MWHGTYSQYNIFTLHLLHLGGDWLCLSSSSNSPSVVALHIFPALLLANKYFINPIRVTILYGVQEHFPQQFLIRLLWKSWDCSDLSVISRKFAVLKFSFFHCPLSLLLFGVSSRFLNSSNNYPFHCFSLTGRMNFIFTIFNGVLL